MTTSAAKRYQHFSEFYPFYLSEHQNRTCRRLHFLGSSAFLALLAWSVFSGDPVWILAGVVCAYGCAWLGHFGFEKNRPASFRQPLFSLMGDWVMYKDIWTGRIAL